MRPERKRDQLQSTGLARARMYLKAHLNWLDGWPVGQSRERVEWRTRPAVGRGVGERLVIDRERLRQTQSAFLKLMAHFPRALPKAVGDVTVWSERVASLLDRLKRAVHHGEDVLAAEAVPWETVPRELRRKLERLVRERPALRETVRAILWSGAIALEQRDALIERVDTHAESLAVLLDANPDDAGLETALLLCDLGRLDGNDATAFPLSMLGSESRQTAVRSDIDGAVDEFVRKLKKWRDPTSPPDKPTREIGHVGREVVQFVNWLGGQRRSVRQRVVRLICLMPLGPIVDEWSAAWDDFISRSHRAIRHLCDFGKLASRIDFQNEAVRVANELDSELDAPLDHIDVGAVLSEVQRISELARPPLFDALCRFLAVIPVDGGPSLTAQQGRRLRMVTRREIALYIHEKHYEQFHLQYLILAEQFFRQHGHQPWCALPWEGLIDAGSGASYFWQSPRETLQGYLDDLKRWPIFFASLARLAAQPGYRFPRNVSVARLTGVTPDVEVVCERFKALIDADLLDELDHRHLSAASALETDGFPFTELCGLVDPVFEEAREITGDLESLARLFQRAGWPQLLPSLLRQKRAADVARVASQCAALGSSVPWPQPVPRPVASELPAWAEPLPREWHSVIADFCQLSPDARRTVERLLIDVCPSRDRLDREIAALECRVAPASCEQHLVTRLVNLRERRDRPRPIPQATLSRLKGRLEESLWRFVFDNVRQQLDATLIGLLTEQTGSQPLARCISSPRHLDLIRALLRLREPYRSLGLRLLKKRWCGIDWNVEDEPANRRFLNELTTRGIRLAPWLSAGVLRTATDAGGKNITMQFERDEVEKLLMGYHFDTCLSTDGCNFFSAVTNAVDLNKQVLYARDEQRRVIGRCLFALGDAGTIMTFHPYCHDGTFPFADHVTAIAADLAASMATLVSSSDHVSPLVAPDWYNDGASNPAVSINHADSPVRLALATTTEESLLATLERTLDPIGLTDTALALIVELPEMEERPQLVRPLLPLLKRCEAKFTPPTLVSLAHLLSKANLHDDAARAVTQRLPSWLLREVKRNGVDTHPANRALELLIEYQPAAALSILRQTRSRQIHSDADEWQESRLLLLSRCYQKLGRSNLAAALERRRQQVS